MRLIATSQAGLLIGGLLVLGLVAVRSYWGRSSVSHACPLPEQPIELNRSTVNELGTLPGMTTSRARALIRYREQLGGFISLFQLYEAGIDSITVAYWTPALYIDTTLVQGLERPWTYRRLKAHPYITARMAWNLMRLQYEGRPQMWKTVLVDSLRICNAALAQKLQFYLGE